MKAIKLLLFFVATATMMTMSSCSKDKEDNSLAGTKWQLVNEQDATYYGVKVIYTVTFGQNNEMTFTRNVDGTDFVMKGTYTYKDGEGVGLLCNEGDTTEYRLTFKVNGNTLSLNFSLRDIVMTKVQ
jgi:hypothetical protein